jgi:acyl carrier protein
MPEVSSSTVQTVLNIIKSIAEIDQLGPDQDFYDAGLTSLASLTLLLELEDSFNVQISDDRFIASRTANELSAVVEELQA